MNTATFIEREDIKPLLKLCFLCLFLIFCLKLLADNTADLDLWGYLAFGRLFWETGRFPYQDIFTYVPTHPVWVYHEWLTGVVYYPLYIYLGPWSLQVLKNMVALATLALIYLTARRRGADFGGAMVMLWVISGVLASDYSPVRAQVFTYFFFALTLFLLETSRETGAWARLGWLIPIQIIWCNLHGGFLAGLGLIGFYAVGEALARRPFWPYLGILTLSGLATLINPYGLDYWVYLFHAIAMPRPEILEWAPWFANLRSGPYQMNSIYFGLIAYFCLSLLWLWRSRDMTMYVALGATLVMGLKHTRHQIFFLLLTAAYLAEPFAPYLTRLRNFQPGQRILARLDYRLSAAAYLTIFFLISFNIAVLQPLRLTTPSFSNNARIQIYYPTAAAEFIQSNNLRGNLATVFDWGEYLLWTLHPQCLIAIDGRYETVYPEKVVRPYMDFLFARTGWQRFLVEYQPDMILIRNNSDISKLLQEEPAWRQVFADAGSVLFVREGAADLCQSGHD